MSGRLGAGERVGDGRDDAPRGGRRAAGTGQGGRRLRPGPGPRHDEPARRDHDDRDGRETAPDRPAPAADPRDRDVEALRRSVGHPAAVRPAAIRAPRRRGRRRRSSSSAARARSRIESGARKSGMTPRSIERRGQPPRVGVADRDVGAAAVGVARAADASSRAARAARRRARSRTRSGRCPSPGSRSMPASADERGRPPRPPRARRSPGVPGQPAADARRRVVALAHRELVALAEPALDRVAELGLELAPDVEEGGRAGAAVEVLVGAADREVDAGCLEVDRRSSRPSGTGPTGRARRRRGRAP